ncbi:hypothetical protein ACFPYJ_24450 [Paenibacillus solisilvae]|uniref:Beta-agarase/YXIM esterase-like galactose-binding domain-containing protein n=1 Tax=Paenibacillus solisilvae TaxID=2486751 RepID=A0ABW0W772_9BACL
MAQQARKYPPQEGSGEPVRLLIVAIGSGLNAWQAEAEPSRYKFDFGNGNVEKGYIGVSASDRYDEKKRYGFHTPEDMIDVPASGTGTASRIRHLR